MFLTNYHVSNILLTHHKVRKNDQTHDIGEGKAFETYHRAIFL